jgi:Holliday junction resolvase-like predicted endonuclease
MTATRQALGRRVEEMVAASLARDGATIVARNARAGALRGEIDIVVLHRGQLVFVEVKGRTAGATVGPERPVVAVTARKRAKLRALAGAWLAQNRDLIPPHRGLRFDVVGVTLDRSGRVVDWEHLKAAF